MFAFSSLFIVTEFVGQVNNFFYLVAGNILEKAVVLFAYPRYDSGRTHPYHPSAPAFYFLLLEHSLKKHAAQVAFT